MGDIIASKLRSDKRVRLAALGVIAKRLGLGQIGGGCSVAVVRGCAFGLSRLCYGLPALVLRFYGGTAMATGLGDLEHLLSAGWYPLKEARRLAGVPLGVSRRFVQVCNGQREIWGGGCQRGERGYYLTFRDLMELRVVNAFRDVGVRWPAIVRAAEYGSRRFGTGYPFSDRRFQTDGAEVFDLGVVGLEQVSGAGQLAFEQLVGDSLFLPLDYVDDTPVRWYPAEDWGLSKVGRSVVVDPKRSFGAPVVAGVHLPTDTLYRNYIGEGGDAHLVARSYEIPVDAVLQAVAFEEGLARRTVPRVNAVPD